MGEDTSDIRLSQQDRLFAELVVQQKLATREQVDACVESLQKLVHSGVSPLPPKAT